MIANPVDAPYHIIERVSAIAFVGVGLAGLFWPAGIGASAFMPLLKSFVPLVLLMLLMLSIGVGRLVAAEMFPDAFPMRIVLAGMSMLLWTQWAIGLFESIPMQGVRPGLFHLSAMAYGELALIYRLMLYAKVRPPADPVVEEL